MEKARYFDEGRLVIFKRSGIYQARTYLGQDRYVWRSLKTRDSEKAVSNGWKVHHDLLDLSKEGLPTTAKRLNEVIDAYVAFREREHERGKTKPGMLRQIKRVAKFWRAYVGTKFIQDIGDKELEAYVEWRRDYYSNLGAPLPKNAKLHPTDGTIQFDLMIGKAIIKWAHEKGWRGNKPRPTYCFTPKKKRVRPAFEIAEYRVLWRTLWKRVRSCPHGNWKASRELLRDYVLVLANSGLRVGEANNLKIRDLHPFTDDVGRKTYRLVVRGKTGERDVIPRATAAKYIERVLERRKDAGPDDYLFVMPNGTKITTLIDQFNAVLEEAGITKHSNGEKYTLYSLRHFYAVMALRRGLDVFAVARNMGTSVQMIQTYYGKQATSKEFASRLGN